jgi:single-strand DNA-binding protein
MASSLNRVFLIGRVTRNPELKNTPKGTAVTELALAINRPIKSDDGLLRSEVLFVDVTLWGRTAEIAAQYLSKGRSCAIEGRLKSDEWIVELSGVFTDRTR